MLILAIETSCDDTSIAIVENGRKVISNITHSQVPQHAKLGGVIPELASREHLKNIIPVLDTILSETKISLDKIDAIAVAKEPGLPGSLLVGISTAKALAYLLNKPLIEVNHLIGHMYSTWLYEGKEKRKDFQFPILYLTVSGGHTSLILMKNHGDFKTLGTTLDDAAGEAFDKVSFLLHGPYPGGPFIDKLAQKGNPESIKFPRGMKNSKDLNFSFSGLKTAVYVYFQKLKVKSQRSKVKGQKSKVYNLFTNHSPLVTFPDIAASFQEAVVDSLLLKLTQAAEKYNPKHVMITGGVSANSRLREKAEEIFGDKLYYPKLKWCTDNAAMIGCAGYYKS